MKIIAVVDEQDQAVPARIVDSTICQVIPEVSEEEKEAHLETSFPWFHVRDDIVDFETPNSRWFLAGRSIAKYECR
jgi:hypothetical protein